MTTPFTGERIRTAREIFGLTQAALRDQAGVSQSLLSQVERGQKPASQDLVESVAKAVDLPLEFFDVVLDEVPLDSLRFRKQQTASAVTTRRAHALFQEGFRVSRLLVEKSGYPRPSLPVATGELQVQGIIELAAETRRALQLDAAKPIPHLMRSVERAGIPVAPVVLPEDDDMSTKNQHFGLSYWSGPDEDAFIGYFPGHQGDRDRFTLAHEVGHLVLHLRRRPADPEREANLFAGELLMPFERARETLSGNLTLNDYRQVKALWGVSIQGLVMRAKQVGAIDDKRSTSLWKQISARGWRRTEPVTVQPENPVLLRRLRRHVYGDKPLRELRSEFALSTTLLKSLLDPGASRVHDDHNNVVSLSARRI